MWINDVRVLHIDLTNRKVRLEHRPDLKDWIGGTGAASKLFEELQGHEIPAGDDKSPIIFATGPLNGVLPLMTKVVSIYRSPYTGDWGESHAGGRLGMVMAYAGIDLLVITGKSERPVYLVIGPHSVEFKDARHLWGLDVFTTGRLIRLHEKRASGRRSILRIGPAAERGVKFAGVNVDTFRHFGRLGLGTLMGMKNLKAIVVVGDDSTHFGVNPEYTKFYKEIYDLVVGSDLLHKYHDLGTPQNVLPLNSIKSLPTKNMQKTQFEYAENISGEYFADNLLVRKIACSGCQVGCIHVGLLREQFGPEHEYKYTQVSYDHELIFALGSMLETKTAEEVLKLIDQVERLGLDAISSGVALAWTTEALERGIISEKDTGIKLQWGDTERYLEALQMLAYRVNDFWHLLGEGTMAAAREYGGEDFAAVLGQEMAGYATGPVYYVSQAMGVRHSHLDTAGYSFDQKATEYTPEAALEYIISEDRRRVVLTSLVSCLFARGLYTWDRVKKGLSIIGYEKQAEEAEEIGDEIRRLRWKLKVAMGYDPDNVKIPKRYFETETFRGKPDPEFTNKLIKMYASHIKELIK
ncbi:aldehyde:ferredoxin oxidoreductase [bacterium 3DAC]|jgi:aldehyde:ferredoxin oxidoreductase|nr:aldehyde:ferredoxin oxidoreductase [Dictyoglomota bacterium]UZN22605.1 aldehyde:ferredoxin oxidoreductase [bacterium 3DAC]